MKIDIIKEAKEAFADKKFVAAVVGIIVMVVTITILLTMHANAVIKLYSH